MIELICISDIHLGADNCQAKLLSEFLHTVGEEADKIVVNGDLFDSLNFSRLPKSHWGIIKKLRKLSKQKEIVWVRGNHDERAEYLSHLIGCEVCDWKIVDTSAGNILFQHGHQYDKFLDDHPLLTWCGDWIYGLLQKIDKTHNLARFAKSTSKQYLRSRTKIENGIMAYARKLGCRNACAGHTHFIESDPFTRYFNSGCWTELPCGYIHVEQGQIQVKTYPVSSL